MTHFQPFDPVHKRTEATVSGPDGTHLQGDQGRPQVILALAANAAQIQPQVEKAVNDFAARGFRSLGVARTDAAGQWQFLGVLPLYDPPRDDSKATIATARQMGIEVKMVTGDQVAIGKEIARQVGLGTNILDASLFAETKPSRGGSAGRGHRAGGRLCPGLPRAQVPHRRGLAEARPHRRHDRRRRQRRPGPEKGRLRHRRLRAPPTPPAPRPTSCC